MGEVNLKWIGKRQFVATDSSKHSVVLSSQDADNGIGMRPAELLLAALGGCAAYDVVGILEKKRQPLKGLELHITGQQDTDPPWAYNHIHVEYVAYGNGISERALAQAIQLSEEKYCSVSATLAGVTEITSSYRIVSEGDA